MIDRYLKIAFKQAICSLKEGGIPIGAALVHKGKLVAEGRNRRIQESSATKHAEMDCLEALGRKPASYYKDCVLYTTLSPCHMCSGAILLYKIPRIIIGESYIFKGPEDYLKSHGVEIFQANDLDCIALLSAFISKNPSLWNEDIGVTNEKEN